MVAVSDVLVGGSNTSTGVLQLPQCPRQVWKSLN
jgi:hypothetical protein